jgi:ribosomal protein S4
MLKQRYNISKIVNQYPWNLSKLKKSLYKRKWFRIKFNSLLLKNRKFFRKKFLKTYENKTKLLFKKFFSPGVTKKQFKKLFKFKNRFRSTFRQILKIEHRLDILLMRIYFLPNIEIARHTIRNGFFLVNNYITVSPKKIINIGDIVEISNKTLWLFFYIHYIRIIASIKKYYNRILLKISYPFI